MSEDCISNLKWQQKYRLIVHAFYIHSLCSLCFILLTADYNTMRYNCENMQLIPITKLIRGKNHETYTCLSDVVGGQHIVKLTTSPFAPKYYFRFISLVGYTLYLENTTKPATSFSFHDPIVFIFSSGTGAGATRSKPDTNSRNLTFYF